MCSNHLQTVPSSPISGKVVFLKIGAWCPKRLETAANSLELCSRLLNKQRNLMGRPSLTTLTWLSSLWEVLLLCGMFLGIFLVKVHDTPPYIVSPLKTGTGMVLVV